MLSAARVYLTLCRPLNYILATVLARLFLFLSVSDVSINQFHVQTPELDPFPVLVGLLLGFTALIITQLPVQALNYCTVLPDMLFRRLFIQSNPQKLFGNPDWYIQWLGMNDCLYPAWYSVLRTLFCVNPHTPSWNVIGDE
jgi:hypothetical protein